MEGEIRAGTLSAKGYKTDGSWPKPRWKPPARPPTVQLTPTGSAINADGEDVSVFTVAVTGRAGPRGA